jgi:hypothetical protein
MPKNKLTTDELPKYEVIEWEGRQARRYPDGAIRNEKGQAIALPPKLAIHAITSENARDMTRLAITKKRETVLRAANKMVQNRELIAEFGDMAYIAEATQTMQQLATTPEAGKSAVMAYESLIKHSGMGEGKDAETGSQPATVTEHALAGLIDAITRNLDVIPMRKDNVLDADIQE